MEPLRTHAEQRQQLHRQTCEIAESYKEPADEKHYCTIQEKCDWISVREATKRFPLGRSTIFLLIKERRIRSLLLRKRGNISGKRLVSTFSIADYIASHATPDVDHRQQANRGNAS